MRSLRPTKFGSSSAIQLFRSRPSVRPSDRPSAFAMHSSAHLPSKHWPFQGTSPHTRFTQMCQATQAALSHVRLPLFPAYCNSQANTCTICCCFGLNILLVHQHSEISTHNANHCAQANLAVVTLLSLCVCVCVRVSRCGSMQRV